MNNFPAPPVQSQNKNSKMSLIFLLLAVVVIAVLAYIFWGGKKVKQPAPEIQKTQNDNATSGPSTVTQVAFDKFPDGFLESFPVPPGGILTENYNVSNNLKVQATRSYESKVNSAVLYKTYKDFFDKEKWQLLTVLDLPETKSISAKKDNITAQVAIEVNKKTKINTVTINFVIKK